MAEEWGEGAEVNGPPAYHSSKNARRMSIQASRPDYLKSLRNNLGEGNAALESEKFKEEEAQSGGEPSLTVAQLRNRYSVLQVAKGGDSLAKSKREVLVRISNYSYNVPIMVDAPQVKTVMNQSPCYAVSSFFSHLREYFSGGRKIGDVFGHYEKKPILKDISLVLKPGTTYLVMGPPACGKTSLLKAISGLLPSHVGANGEPKKRKAHSSGRIEYNGVSVEDDPNLVLQNLVSFVCQHDNHAPFLTVRETFEFANDCRTGTTGKGTSEEEIEDKKLSENLTIDGLDLAVCSETFVGDANNRGVSGGQRRRVTVGEMMVGQNPVACADEISTGLDAAVTYDIARSIVNFSKAAGTTRLVSLLQPGPETFSLFDEVILLAKGQVIYAGPIDEVMDYFASLGYHPPNTMDVADFLQSVATPDGELMFHAGDSPAEKHYSSEEFADAFRSSDRYRKIEAELSSEVPHNWGKKQTQTVDEEAPASNEEGDGTGGAAVPDEYKKQYANSLSTAIGLNTKRHLTLLKRDKEFLIGKTIENFGMGIGMALIFCQAAAYPSSINGSDALANFIDGGCKDEQFNAKVSEGYQKLLAGTYSSIFLTAFHILLGTLTSTPDEVDTRIIYYKHANARFHQAAAYLIGRQVSQLPLLAMEIVAFGVPFYFIAGLAYDPAAFFIYLAMLICYKFALKMLYGILAMTLPKKANVQGIGTFLYLLTTLFGGFVVYPETIPYYYTWLYWINPMQWAMQGMASNQFYSSVYNGVGCASIPALGNWALRSPRGWQTGKEWIGYSFAFMIPFTIGCGLVVWLALKYIRIEPERQHVKEEVSIGKVKQQANEFNIPFIPVDLTFDTLVYEVEASTTKETLRLLNEVSGAFMAGRMCALMGSSGAGKTTLMDVIALRKTSGTITGKVELNGYEQERTSFLRCSGYVEQFDVQQPELTIRETVVFSARLRLDANDPAIGDDTTKLQFVDHVLDTMELTDEQTLQVGSFEEGGLSFEQRKRLAIACELAGSPSVIFLDEPTSGLDSRGALVVIRAMRRISDSGRTVCATIHQPSAAVFEMFDDLILLKKGGNVVFFGELGEESSKLVEYFEARGAKPIERGENPAAWVLRAYAGENTSNDVDWAELHKESDQFKMVRDQIEAVRKSLDESKRLTFDSTFSTPLMERMALMLSRMLTIYRRSPPYNMTRLLVSAFYAFILGSIFVQTAYSRESIVWSENRAAALIGTMFLSLNVIGTTAMTMAIPVSKRIRDVFYKHRASGMLGHNALAYSMAVAELPYLTLVAFSFVVVYCATAGLFTTAGNFFWFFLFFFLHTASYSFFAQCFMCLVRDEKTVGALQGVWIGLNLFYAGFVVLPQNFFSFFELGIWINASRYALEGIVFTQFQGLNIPVKAEFGSPYWFSLGCTVETAETCDKTSTLVEYADNYFGGKFSASNRGLDVGILISWNILALFGTWFCLKKFNYVNT
uniref:ABC transporter domain-containing protein n=1 Tax=Odontella aurita TaxID=265563 RepID=A0A7S4MWX6_9STRA|mmetsp:Transcript_373/g.1102  ORF Transcript_373/g.1102 Transcript_373/m.1102 type:complete len:1461 (+) Transcript_373:154-4536(+)